MFNGSVPDFEASLRSVPGELHGQMDALESRAFAAPRDLPLPKPLSGELRLPAIGN